MLFELSATTVRPRYSSWRPGRRVVLPYWPLRCHNRIMLLAGFSPQLATGGVAVKDLDYLWRPETLVTVATVKVISAILSEPCCR